MSYRQSGGQQAVTVSSPGATAAAAGDSESSFANSDSLVRLKELVEGTLERRGVLGSLRAQLRAAVLMAMDEHRSEGKSIHMENEKLTQAKQTQEGRLALRLVGDLLDALGLQSTRAVLCAEASLTETEDRNQLQQTLKIDAGSAPVLQELVRMQMSGDAGSKMGTFGARKSNSGAPALGDASSSKTAPRDEEGAITSGRDTDSKPDGARSSGEVRSDGNSSAGASAANAGGKGGDTDDGEDEYGDDDYEDDDDFEDVASDGSDIALEIADDGLIEQSASFSDSFETSGSRSRGVAGSKVEDQSSDSLSMSTSIVHDSMDLSVQGSLALDQYDFVEVAQRPK